MPVVALDSPSPKRSIVGLLFLLAILLFAGPERAFGQASCNYIGGAGPTDWTTATNWSCTPLQSYPGVGTLDTATISTSVAFTVTGTVNPVGIAFFGLPAVQFNSGTLPLASAALTSGGTIQVNSGATVDVIAGANLSFGLSCNVVVAGGTLTNNGTMNFTPPGGVLTVSSGTLTNNTANGIVIQGLASAGTPGTFNWSGGTLDGTGSTLIQSGLTNGILNVTGPVALNGPQTLNNGGTLNLGGSISTASGAPLIANGGSISQSVATSTIAPALNNTGTVAIVPTGGAMTLTGGGTHSGTFNSVNTGTFIFGGGTHIFNAGSTFTGGSNATVTGGTFQANTVLNIPLALTNSGGTIQFDPLTIQAIVPGSFVQSGGTVKFKLNGTAAGTYDQIRTPGPAALGGAIGATVGYAPTIGDTYSVITDGSESGDFTTPNPIQTFSNGAIFESPKPPTGTSVTLAAVGADVAITKTGPPSITAGSTVSYTMTVTNNGPATATGVVISDLAPAGLSFASASTPCSAGFPCSIGTLPVGSPVTITSTYNVAPSATGTISNTASVSSTTFDPLLSNNSGTATSTVATSADLSITKTGPATVNAGSPITYTITVKNLGPSDAAAVTVSDVAPAGLTFSSNSGACVTAFPCSLGTLPFGGTMTITSTYTTAANATGTVTNTATVSSSTSDPALANNTASASTAYTASADLAVTKTGPASATAGTTVSYSITVTNNGPSDASGVVLTDPAPAGLTFTSASAPCSGGFPCSIGTVTVGTPVTVNATYSVASSATGTITNTAGVTASTTDPLSANNSSSASTAITTSADLVLAKSGPASAIAGSTVSYSITITNNGPSDSAGVTLTDATPAGMTFVSATSPCSAGVTSCSIGTIPSAVGTNIVTITVVYSVPSSATGTVTNTASVSATTPDPLPTNNTVTTPATTITTKADLAVSKSGPSNAPVGSNVTYVITVVNNGPSDAQGVVLTDPTPSGLSFVSASSPCSAGVTSCTLGPLPAGQNKTITATFKVLSGPVTNTASVTATTTDPNPSNNSASVTTSTSCPSAPPANPAPADGSTNIPTSGVLSWNGDGASSYTVYLDVAGPNACSKFFGSTTSTSIPYFGLQQGTTYQWRIVASTSGCPAVQTTSCMTFTTVSTCPQTAPTLISPLNTTVSGPATFTWSSVAGATDYRLFVNGNLIATTTSTSFGPVAVGSGSVSWYVVADFGSACGSLQSPPGSFNGCDTSTAPILSVVGESAAGQSYDVTWNAIPGATQYQIDEAVDASFNSPATQTVTTTDVPFSHTVITTTAYFYRVRAFIPCANGYSANSIPVRVVLTPLNIVSGNPNVAAPVGSTTRMQVIVHVPGFADGSFPFTASLDQPWLIAVSPLTGVLPPQGIDLTVTVDPTGLPNGTFTGTIILTIGSGKSGLIGTNGTTTVSAPISVSLVTPVTPKAAGTPSADTLIIPSLGHLDGINSQWQSDVRLANLSSAAASYQVTFTPADTSQMPRQTVINVGPGVTTALDDIVNTWFGVGALGDSANGVLQIQRLQVSGKDNSVSVSFATAVSSRTYNQATNSNGTYGQFIPAIPFSNFVGAANASTPATVLGLQQIAQSSAYRTNVGVVEGAGQPATVLISAFDDAGNKLLDSPLSLLPNQQVQLNSFLAQNGIPLSDGRLEIKVLSGSGMITTYASVIDNRTGDPLLMSGVPIGQTVSADYVVPGVADLNTANAAWRTDMRIFNPASTAQFVTATFYPQNNGTPQTTGFTVNPGQVDRIDGVLASLFNGAAANMGGALHLSLGNPASLVVTGRTYNFASNGGTYGQFIPAVTSADAVGNGDRALQILQTEDSVRFRTNIGIAEVTGNPATVQISVVIPNSKVSPSTQIPLQPNEFIQIPVIQSLGLTNVYNARISIQVVGGTGKIAAYGSVIDQTTQAPTYIPAQ